MTSIGIVSPGAMGAALGRAWQAGGADAVATLAGRSRRTGELAAGLRLLDSLDDVVSTSDLVVSICPPSVAERCLTEIVAAARRTTSRPLIADLNAVAPATIDTLVSIAHGFDLVDGSISGHPPVPGGGTMLYLSGPRADEVAALPADGLRTRIVGDRPGQASAVKMCTASVYKGTTAIWAQALQTADNLEVLDVVLDDLTEEFPGTAHAAGKLIALAASKSARFVGEMEQISVTQGAAGASPELFEAMAAVYARVSRTPLASLSPEQAAALTDLREVLSRLR